MTHAVVHDHVLGHELFRRLAVELATAHVHSMDGMTGMATMSTMYWLRAQCFRHQRGTLLGQPFRHMHNLPVLLPLHIVT